MNRFKSFLKFTFCHSCHYRFLFSLSAERSDPFHPTAIANANDRRVIFMRTRAFEKFLLKQRPRRSRERYIHRETQYRRRDVGLVYFALAGTTPPEK